MNVGFHTKRRGAFGSPCEDDTGSEFGPFVNAVRFFEEQRSPENPRITPWTGYYLVGTAPGQAELRATRGNLVAALGLAKMDRALLQWQQGDAKRSLANVGMAWRCALVATALNQHHLTAHYFMHRLPIVQATARAKSRHLKDPKQMAKKFVFECWRDWTSRPDRYPSIAAFARAMLDKKPDELTSEVVISRWVRAWQRDFA